MALIASFDACESAIFARNLRTVNETAVIEKILTHIRLDEWVPPIAPALAELFEVIEAA